jgi:hypothetical protein
MYSSRSARKARRRQASARRIQPRLTTSTGLSNLDGPVTPQQVDMMYKWLVGYGEVAQRALAPHLFPVILHNIAQVETNTLYSLPISYPPVNAPPHGFPLGIYAFTTGNFPSLSTMPCTFYLSITLGESPTPTAVTLYSGTWYSTIRSLGVNIMSDESLHDIYNCARTIVHTYANTVSSQSTFARTFSTLVNWSAPPIISFRWTSETEPTNVGFRVIVLYAVPTVN